MTFKPGDLVRPTVHRRRFNGCKLALVAKVLDVRDQSVTDICIQWFKTGVRTWEYTDLFEKVSK
jgi:hypothetical protein